MLTNTNRIKEFANCLKEYIGNESISSVAKKIGIPQETLRSYLRCQREIGLENLCKIADFFHEDLDILTGRRDY